MSETKPVRFEFTDVNPKNRFVIELKEAAKIEHARRILRGEETARTGIQGTVVKQKVDYNPDWSYHLKPESIDFFEVAVEVCDSSIEYLEDHLGEACGSFLPDCHWCPWSSKLVREL